MWYCPRCVPRLGRWKSPKQSRCRNQSGANYVSLPWDYCRGLHSTTQKSEMADQTSSS